MIRWRTWSLLLGAALAGGCAEPMNPAFPVTTEQAQADIKLMDANPVSLPRPLVIIGGLDDPGVFPASLSCSFDHLTAHDRFVVVALADCHSIDACRAKIIHCVEELYPSGDPRQTTPVDVVAYSLGGVAAEYAALPLLEGGQNLHIVRLFTISSPLQGASFARYTPAITPLVRQLRPGSGLMKMLADNPPTYPVYSYVRLYDYVIGDQHAANAGETPWWAPKPFLELPHTDAPTDARIIADIARRLRDQQPLTLEPPAPLPG